MILKSATVAERNAAFDAVHKVIVHALQDDRIPYFVKSMATEKLESPEGRALVLDTIDAALTAAEKVRAGG